MPGVGRTALIRILLFRQSFDLRDQLIDFFRRQLSGELGHMTFPVADDVAQIVAGRGGNLFRCERRSSKVSPRSSLAVAFFAVFLVNGIVNQRCIRVRRLGRDSDGQQANSIDGNRNPDRFQLRLPLLL